MNCSIGLAGINYLTKIKTQLKADIDVNSKDKKLTLKENELQLNQLDALLLTDLFAMQEKRW